MEVSGICLYCEKITSLQTIQKKTEVEVRGEIVTVLSAFFQCTACHGEFAEPGSHNDILIAAYREYRHRHGMLQPEDIYRLRKLYNLTQKELSELLFCEEKMISQVEYRKLQSHDQTSMLRLIRNLLNNQKE